MDTGAIHLLRERKFLPFFLTQFFGTFNDNAFKLSMLTLISYHLAHTQHQSEYYQALAGALFIAPFFLFSATAGQLADKYDKTKMIQYIKLFEVLLMIFGSIALYWQSIFLMMSTLTGLGVHSAFFGPIKYSILPQHLPKQDLLAGTGLIESSTFLAILLGTTLGTLVISSANARPYAAIFMTVLIAILGFISSIFIPRTPSLINNLKIDYYFWRAPFRLMKKIGAYHGVFLTILILSWFWLVGGVIVTKLPDYTHYILNADTTVFALFLALFSIGIALGSLVVNYIFRGKLVMAIVPWAMLLFTLFLFDLYRVPYLITKADVLLTVRTFFTSFEHCRIAFDLFMSAFSAGFFLVPLYTYLQIASPDSFRGQTIAANNIYNALFMVLGTFMVLFLLHLHVTIPQVFLILSLLNLLVSIGARIFLNKLI